MILSPLALTAGLPVKIFFPELKGRRVYRVSANFVAILNLFFGFDEPPTFVFWMCFSRRNSKKTNLKQFWRTPCKL